MAGHTDISVVIVNYRVKHFLEQTVRAVMQASQGLQVEVFVVDNNSGDDSIAFCRERFPQVTYIENADNVGFARANNQAIMQAQGDYTLILNPDTIVTSQCLSQGISWMQQHPDCGAIGARMTDGNGVFLPESKRAFPTPWVSFCKIFGLSKLFPRSRWFAKYHLRYLSDSEPHQVDILSGAYMLCRTTLLKQLGGFDEDFFMYGEDIDLSYRIVKAGYQNWFLPTPMIHYKGESTHKGSMRYVRIFYNAMLIFYRKHYPHYSVVFYPVVKAGVALRAGLAMARRGLQRLVPHHSATAQALPWIIVSDDPAQVARQAGIADYLTDLPQQGQRCNVLIDDGCHTYDQVVALITRHGDTAAGHAFHIFAARHGIVITPGMSQQQPQKP